MPGRDVRRCASSVAGPGAPYGSRAMRTRMPDAGIPPRASRATTSRRTTAAHAAGIPGETAIVAAGASRAESSSGGASCGDARARSTTASSVEGAPAAARRGPARSTVAPAGSTSGTWDAP